MKMSARNRLVGKVKSIKKGPVNSEVILEIPGGHEIVSVITTHSVENLGLDVGKEATAFIKASNVMVLIE